MLWLAFMAWSGGMFLFGYGMAKLDSFMGRVAKAAESLKAANPHIDFGDNSQQN